MLKIYNTLARRKQDFVPIEPGRVRMYVCGMTVYDYCHLGHARVMVVFDVVRRWLQASGFSVRYVRNITDIEDRIIKRANENGETIWVAHRALHPLHGRGCSRARGGQARLRAACYRVPSRHMLRIIQALIERGLAYHAPGGDVYYSVYKFPGYGKLSGKSLDDLRAGERVDIDPAKQKIRWTSEAVEVGRSLVNRLRDSQGRRSGWHTSNARA